MAVMVESLQMSQHCIHDVLSGQLHRPFFTWFSTHNNMDNNIFVALGDLSLHLSQHCIHIAVPEYLHLAFLLCQPSPQLLVGSFDFKRPIAPLFCCIFFFVLIWRK